MRWVVIGLAGVMTAGLDACFMLRCDDGVHGVRDGERFETTILGPYVEPNRMSASGCGDLGDLTAGTTLRWTARPDGPGDGCDDHLDVEAESVSSGQVSRNQLTLPNGCTGNWFLSVHSLTDGSDLKTTVDRENPTWYLRRTFAATSPANCFGAGSSQVNCDDAFIATSTTR
jgi:hypothetical protein